MKVKFVVMLVLILCLTGLAFPQSESGRLFGTVTDASGAAIAGATVKVTQLATNRVVTVQSQGDGSYVVNALPIGNYKVEATQQAFKSESANFALEISEVKEINFKLQVGQVSETVEVTNEIPLVDTATSSAGEVIQGRQVIDLPLNGRNFTSLALLTPGVSRGQYSDNASAPNNNAETWRNSDSGAAALAANGLRPQTNNFIMDGIDDNESLVNTIVIFPAIEDIAEFKTTTSTAPAEFGRAGGAVVQVATKSGTNQIHGAFYEFNRSKIAAADVTQYTSAPHCTYLGESNCVALPELSRNQFGATLGGPIWKNKIFAFVDYQGWRQKLPAGIDNTHVPTALMRQGNFTELYSPTGSGNATSLPNAALPGCDAVTGARATQPNAFLGAGYGYVFDPTTCLPFGWDTTTDSPGPNINIIPSTSQIQAGINYLNAFPIANIAGADIATNANNFTHLQSDVISRDDYDARLDFVVSSKDSVFARYSLGQDFLNSVPPLQDSNHLLPSGNGTNPSHPRQVIVGWTHILSPTVVNEFHYGWIRDLSGYQQPDSSIPLAASLGIANANTSPLLAGMPIIGGWYGNISYVGDGGPYLIIEPTNQFTDSVSWTKGKHTFKFGASIIHRDVNWDQGNNAKGYFWIDDGGYGAYPAPTSAHGTFTGFEDSELLAGFMGAYEAGAFSGYYNTRGWENGFFGQDDFRVNRRLTLNLGLRYDTLSWPYEKNNHMSNFDPSTGELVEAGASGWPKALINTPHNDWGPRIGFAYDLKDDGKTVIRGGYGMYYYLDRGGVAEELSENPDWNGAQTYYACPSATTCGTGYRFTLSGQAALGATDPTTATQSLPSKVGVNPTAINNTDTVIYYPKNSPNSKIQQWNIQVERALDSATSLNVAYVGTHMSNLATQFNANANPLAAGSQSWFPVGGPINPLGVGTINAYETIGTGHYNGLQTKLTRRMSHGLQVLGMYTYSHAKDNSDDVLSNAGSLVIGANGTPLLQYQEGNSDNDQRQMFAAAALYELPFGRGKTFGHDMPRAVDYILGGWQWNNVIIEQTGTPMDLSGAGTYGRPNYSGGCTTGHSWRTDTSTNLPAPYWINCPASAFSVPAANTVGNLPRNYFPGPGTHTWDTSLSKKFTVAERVSADFRVQIYNLFNTPQYQIPDSNINDISNGNFGQLNNPRIAPPNRQLELALRVSF